MSRVLLVLQHAVSICRSISAMKTTVLELAALEILLYTSVAVNMLSNKKRLDGINKTKCICGASGSGEAAPAAVEETGRRGAGRRC
uniref:Uncharacterized protein n=1 Tax=Oryza punctata TaxID=4537 RepID=A0A0E0JP49_ORYPU